MKKVLGSLFFAYGVYAVISMGQSLMERDGAYYSQPQIVGNIIAIILAMVAFVGSGIYFFKLAKSDNAAFSESYKMRKTLAGLSVVCVAVLFLILMASIKSAIDVVSNMHTIQDRIGKSMFERIIGDIPYTLLLVLPILIPTIIMGLACDEYTMPFFDGKKALKRYNINTLLSGEFQAITSMKKNNIYTNGQVIYFSKTSVTIPLGNIAYVEKNKKLYYTGMRRYIIFNLRNGEIVKVMSDAYDEVNKYIKSLAEIE